MSFGTGITVSVRSLEIIGLTLALLEMCCAFEEHSRDELLAGIHRFSSRCSGRW